MKKIKTLNEYCLEIEQILESYSSDFHFIISMSYSKNFKKLRTSLYLYPETQNQEILKTVFKEVESFDTLPLLIDYLKSCIISIKNKSHEKTDIIDNEQL